MAITYPTDFLESDLRPGELYELIIALGLDISESAFRQIISDLNVKFITPRVIFSGVLQPELKIFYSTDGYGMSQAQITFALMSGFENFLPSINFEKSEGEVPGGVPLVTPKVQEAPVLSLDWLKRGYEEIVESITQKTGLPGWTILPLAGSILVFLIIALRTKPVIIIKSL